MDDPGYLPFDTVALLFSQLVSSEVEQGITFNEDEEGFNGANDLCPWGILAAFTSSWTPNWRP